MSNEICLRAIATVRNERLKPEDDNWDAVVSEIQLSDDLSSDLLIGLDTFSHVEVIFIFDQVEKINTSSRRPRSNPDWPVTGMLAQRGKNRLNRIGLTVAKIIRVHEQTITVRGLDAINGTPVLDIKPVMREFLPREEIRQPQWATELMQHYWQRGDTE